ncbi:MAG: Acetoacetyl-CoA synthetase [uncultured Solirubrobacterales bacterium]|uniref:Acetoacetyl-CoA synthetase n=1 Tax=uncultured Solirubrobacterales bacterium TaxID=768556 RepID=A0A6J4RUF2_9ACTN|nr:MAG: Acetoacetyl-CoA synthetase [uncultured Solirubrobacterales bacterium]
MATESVEGDLLWEPSEELAERAAMSGYMRWLERERGLSFGTYGELWEWSVTELEDFWATVWEYFEIDASKSYETVLERRVMPGARWFSGAELNYAEHVLRRTRGAETAVIAASELRARSETSWDELEEQVARAAAALRELGVARGDRVVAYLPNIPETLTAFLACASLGAIWSSCSPDFGARSVVDRFSQIEPKVLFAVDGYRYGGRDFDRTDTVAELQRELPTLEQTVLLPYLSHEADLGALGDVTPWDAFLASSPSSVLEFEQVPFDHPLWVLYSSGTTGLPKPIVQGHGGIVLEHLKMCSLHMDLGPDDRFFWFTTTGWMMWNLLVGGLLVGSAVVLYDGSPAEPGLGVLWDLVERAGITCFGTSATYIASLHGAGLAPGDDHDLSGLKSVGSTGSPLSAEGFRFVYEGIKADAWLFSTSGGTDLCTAFVTGCPLLPVHVGELQCRALGARVEAFDERGNSLMDEVGELVITEPMPSMPLYLWGDENGQRLHESYFDTYPGVWRHGDWIRITPRGSAVIQGRSDATINRGGVRMGTAEIYSAVNAVDAVSDSLVVDVATSEGRAVMPLFVVLEPGAELGDDLRAEIKRRIRDECSPRHVPDAIHPIAEVPRTLNGKILEVPVKKILTGTPVAEAANPDSLANPQALEFFARLADEL